MAKKDGSVKFQITMTSATTAKVQALADEFGISRSAAVNVLVSQGLQARESIDTLSNLMDMYKSEKSEKEQKASTEE